MTAEESADTCAHCGAAIAAGEAACRECGATELALAKPPSARSTHTPMKAAIALLKLFGLLLVFAAAAFLLLVIIGVILYAIWAATCDPNCDLP